MFASLLRNRSSRRKPSRRFQVEALEDRVLLSAAPFVYSVLNDGGHGAGHSMAAAQSVALAPMMDSQVVNANWGNGTSDWFKVDLKKGQTFTASAQAVKLISPVPNVQVPVPIPNQIDLVDATGHELVGSGSLQQLDPNGGPAFVYRVAADGTYYVHFSTLQNTAQTPAYYQLDLRSIGLNPGMQDPAWLSKTGGELDVWLDGKTLDVAGPAGHGFGIRGNWTETVTNTKAGAAATYSASGLVYLQTAAGEVPMTVPNGATFTITTKASKWGAYYGELDTVSDPANLSTSDLGAPFGAGTSFGLGLQSALPHGGFGIKLGSDLQDTGAPVNAAVPYLYSMRSDDLSLSFGGITLQAKNVTGEGVVVVSDPADPFLYVAIKDLPGPVPNLAFGGSIHRLIPFVAGAVPDHYTGTVFGQVFTSSTLDLADATNDEVPISIDGDITLNFDPRHTGKAFGGAFDSASSFVAQAQKGKISKSAAALKAFDTALHNVSFGHNGQLDVTFDVIDNRLGLQIPVIHDTDAWDGVTQQFYLHGGTIDPLKNTPLADLVRSRADIDGYFNRNTGKYDFKISGDLQLFGSGSTGYVEFDNAGAHLNAHLYPLGVDLLFQGDIYANGDYDLQAKGTVDLLVAKPAATFHLVKKGSQTALHLTATVSALGTNFSVTGDSYSNGDFRIIGSASQSFFLANGQADFTYARTKGATSFQLNGHLTALATRIDVTGSVGPSGDFSLVGYSDTNLFLGHDRAKFILSRFGGVTTLGVDAHLAALGTVINLTGNVSSNGDFKVSGSAYANYYVASGWGVFTFQSVGGNTTFHLDAHANFLGADVNLVGDGYANGDFRFLGTAAANFFLADGQAYVNFQRQNGVTTCHVNANLNALGIHVFLNGDVGANGDFTFRYDTGVNLLNLFSADVNFTFSRTAGVTSFKGHLHGMVSALVVRGTLDADLTIVASTSRRVAYSGSAVAAAQVWKPGGWVTVGQVGVGVSNDSLNVLGVVIPLPH